MERAKEKKEKEKQETQSPKVSGENKLRKHFHCVKEKF